MASVPDYKVINLVCLTMMMEVYPLIFFTILIFEGLTVQLEYSIVQYLVNAQLHASKA